MSLIVTPGQFSRRAELYQQLGQLTSAGLGIVRALEQIQRSPPDRADREPLRKMLDGIAQGRTFTEAASRAGGWLPAFDLALLQAGETSGRLDACFRVLADYYTDRARIARQVIGDLLYPVGLLHFAIFLFPFASFFASGNALLYLAQTFGVLLPLYLVAGVFIFAMQGRHGEAWRGVIESLLHPIPLLGTARHYLALARLATALEALISAGVSIIEAWELAASASGSPALKQIVSAWKPQFAAGRTPAETVGDCSRFPEMFASLYATGEVSGKLDESLRQLRQYYQEEGARKLHAVAQWTPRLVYLIVALIIAWRVVMFWTGYFKTIQDAGGF